MKTATDSQCYNNTTLLLMDIQLNSIFYVEINHRFFDFNLKLNLCLKRIFLKNQMLLKNKVFPLIWVLYMLLMYLRFVEMKWFGLEISELLVYNGILIKFLECVVWGGERVQEMPLKNHLFCRLIVLWIF